jgi:lipopolysaccharide transport system ATP-binding protein
MSDDIILKVTNLSKQYRLGTVGTGTLSHDLNRAWHKLRGKEDPYLKIGAVNDRGAKATSDYVWALQDINFEVKRGEILGIIGKNGAGKSTLLKILSRVTSPTTGSIKVGGRMASLLEVGTGMHPELTGKENIYLNGAILGMTKAEIASKIDEIVAFSGCEMYIDTPVKRYSSGMGVRLGFAVAAFLEPDILVVDEVLAVGDAEFQKKAIGKMQDISNTSGRTVLFVSHNMTTIKSLCHRTVVLENGLITFDGFTDDGINFYLQKAITNESSWFNNSIDRGINQIISVQFKNDKQLDAAFFAHQEVIFITIEINITETPCTLAFNLKDGNESLIFIQEISVFKSEVKTFKIPKALLLKGIYLFDVHLYVPNIFFYHSLTNSLRFEIVDLPSSYGKYDNAKCGIILSPLELVIE